MVSIGPPLNNTGTTAYFCDSENEMLYWQVHQTYNRSTEEVKIVDNGYNHREFYKNSDREFYYHWFCTLVNERMNK